MKKILTILSLSVPFLMMGCASNSDKADGENKFSIMSNVEKDKDNYFVVILKENGEVIRKKSTLIKTMNENSRDNLLKILETHRVLLKIKRHLEEVDELDDSEDNEDDKKHIKLAEILEKISHEEGDVYQKIVQERNNGNLKLSDSEMHYLLEKIMKINVQEILYKDYLYGNVDLYHLKNEKDNRDLEDMRFLLNYRDSSKNLGEGKVKGSETKYIAYHFNKKNEGKCESIKVNELPVLLDKNSRKEKMNTEVFFAFCHKSKILD